MASGILDRMLANLTELAAGEIVDGRFRIVATLGAGGIGTVYRAVEVEGGQEVALKLLHDDFGDREARLRFEREARALAALHHPHVVPIRGFGVAGRTPYLVMELLPGRTLFDVLAAEAPLEPARALNLARQIVTAVAFIHGEGIIHRDLKSPNVMIEHFGDGSEHARVLDFGFAKFLDKEKWQDEQTLTNEGSVFGTLQYMAPEQAVGAKVSTQADVYALGVLVFELITGARPFLSDDRQELFEMHMLAPVPAFRDVRPELSAAPALEQVVRTALAKEPGKRFTDARVMKNALDAVPVPTLGGGGRATRSGTRGALPRWAVAAALVAFAVAVATAVALR